jgi:hypothetical protein
MSSSSRHSGGGAVSVIRKHDQSEFALPEGNEDTVSKICIHENYVMACSWAGDIRIWKLRLGGNTAEVKAKVKYQAPLLSCFFDAVLSCENFRFFG